MNSVEDGQPDKLLPEVERYLFNELGRPVSGVSVLSEKMRQHAYQHHGHHHGHHHHGHHHHGHHSHHATGKMKGSIRRSRSIKVPKHPLEGILTKVLFLYEYDFEIFFFFAFEKETTLFTRISGPE